MTDTGMASCCPFNIEDETAVLLPLKRSFYIPELPFHLPWEQGAAWWSGKRMGCGVGLTNLGSTPSLPLIGSVTLGKLTLTSQSLEGILVC